MIVMPDGGHVLHCSFVSEGYSYVGRSSVRAGDIVISSLILDDVFDRNMPLVEDETTYLVYG